MTDGTRQPADGGGGAAPLTAEVEELRAHVAELLRTFDLRWDADQRAIKAWQEAHPGNDMVWPDHADMVVWLLAERDRMGADLERLRAVRAKDAEVRAIVEQNATLRIERDQLRADLAAATPAAPTCNHRSSYWKHMEGRCPDGACAAPPIRWCPDCQSQVDVPR